MLGNTSFGFSGSGGSTPPPVSNNWLLDGNTNGAEKYFGTNDNFSIPLYTNGIARGIILNTGDFGFGTTTPTSRVHITGLDSTSLNYALKVDNSAISPLLYVRNDGATLFNNSAFINNSTSAFQSILAGDNLGTLNNNLNIYAGVGTPSSNTFRISYYGNTQWLSAFSIQNSGASFGNLLIMPNGGKVGIGILTPSATTHIKGIDATATNFALKVDNSANSNLLFVRNDGIVNMGDDLGDTYLSFDPVNKSFLVGFPTSTFGISPDSFALYDNYNYIQSGDTGGGSVLTNSITNSFKITEYVFGTILFNMSSTGMLSVPLLPTSNSGLTTGDMYVDTAANILANGDKVVGWKV